MEEVDSFSQDLFCLASLYTLMPADRNAKRKRELPLREKRKKIIIVRIRDTCKEPWS